MAKSWCSIIPYWKRLWTASKRLLPTMQSVRKQLSIMILDEYDERFLRHLALGYTKEMIANLKGMPFGVKSLEKRQNDLVGRLFPNGERVGVNATRLVVRALELRILDLDNLEADEE